MFWTFYFWVGNFQNDKMPLSRTFWLKMKNKTTLFSSTLKVWWNKVVLFFLFELKQARYGHFLDFYISGLLSPFVKLKWGCNMRLLRNLTISFQIYPLYVSGQPYKKHQVDLTTFLFLSPPWLPNFFLKI